MAIRWKCLTPIFLFALAAGCNYNSTPKSIESCPPAVTLEIPATDPIDSIESDSSDSLSEYALVHADKRLHNVVTQTRNAFVGVDNFHRHVRGSGTYYTFNDYHLVITAAHVVDGNAELIGITTPSGERVLARIIYFNMMGRDDLAALLLDSPLESRVPMDLEFRDLSGDKAEQLVGESVIYTGSPGHHEQLTITGRVGGYTSGGSIIMHSYAWGGASGSNIFDNRGRLIGILKAVDINRSGISPYPQLTEDIVWITPTSGLDLERLAVVLEIHRLISQLED
tara:strand:- start:6817 stop:7662 length:846 start_codon:yes stop_codon:yes gene_type:complete